MLLGTKTKKMTCTMILLFMLGLSAASGIREGAYLLGCGPVSNSGDDHSARPWSHDDYATFSPLSAFSSTVAASFSRGPSIPSEPPYMGARIFNSSFTYTFPVPPGPKFLRLYFYPAVYSPEYDTSEFYITVQANEHVLLRNFSAQLSVNYAPYTLRDNKTTSDQNVIKEYYVTIPDGHTYLNLTFTPTPPSPYAFVNGIELVPVPENFYVTNQTVENVNSISIPIQILKSTALETAYRLNVGGSSLSAKTDGVISGMYRTWCVDDPYTFMEYGVPGMTDFPINYTKQVPNYAAPEKVYQTFKQLPYASNTNVKSNLTWRFKVDPGFSYMVRLHWCEVDTHVNTTGDRVFDVYINGMPAESSMDVLMRTAEEKYVPYYKDYVVYVAEDDAGGGSQDIWISLNTTPQLYSRYNEVLLNGLEMFKMNKPDDFSLNAPNPHISSYNTYSQQSPHNAELPKRSRHVLLAIIVGVAAGILLITSVVCLLIFGRWKAKKELSTHDKSTDKPNWHISSSFQSRSKTTISVRSSTLPTHLCRQFSLDEIRLATEDFHEGLIIGHGGFGNVYKGMVLDGEKGTFAVAIKQLNASSKQGLREFMTEIEMLSKLRHIHLVSLIGFCDDAGEMILVYEYMDHGTLRDHLYNTDNPPLSWKQRLNACLGAAKGLDYLHSGASHMIIHRDVKSTNILLDEKWVSKVSDFGLSKLGPMGGEFSHVSTAVKGSIGYLDIEYYKSQRLTEKSDVYSFGVVLFEVLCGRHAVDPSLPKEEVSLAKWARTHHRNGTIDVIVDLKIKDEIAPGCLHTFGDIAESCIREHGTDRPSMADVVWSLEYVLDLQQRADDAMSNYNNTTLPSIKVTNTTSTTANNDFCFSSASGEHLTRKSSSSALILSESEYYGESTNNSVFS